MAAQRRNGPGLAGRIVRVTLFVGAVTVLTAGTVALLGASRLAAQQVAARDQASLQLVQDEIVGRFSSIETFASRAAEQVTSQRDTRVLDTNLSPIPRAG